MTFLEKMIMHYNHGILTYYSILFATNMFLQHGLKTWTAENQFQTS